MGWGGGSPILDKMLSSIDSVDCCQGAKRILLQDLIEALEQQGWDNLGDEDFDEWPYWARVLINRMKPYWFNAHPFDEDN